MTRYTGRSPLPERIGRLEELALDLWWSWHPEARAIFRRLDYGLWRRTAHNPVRMLWAIAYEKLDSAARDPEFLQIYDSAIAGLDAARAARNTWWSHRFPQLTGQPIAYFSAEFALHQSLPIYAGGLGVLAGDHCKDASDLGVPWFGAGFMYRRGNSHQNVPAEGGQEESYKRWTGTKPPGDPPTATEG